MYNHIFSIILSSSENNEMPFIILIMLFLLALFWYEKGGYVVGSNEEGCIKWNKWGVTHERTTNILSMK